MGGKRKIINDLLAQILKKKKKDNSTSSSSSSSTSSDSTDSSSNSESKKKAKKVSKKRLKKRKIDKKHGEGTSTPKKFDARNIINKNKDSSNNKKAALRKRDRQTDRDDKIEKLRNVKTIGDYLSFQEQYFKLYLIRTTDKAKCCPNYNLGVICKQKRLQDMNYPTCCCQYTGLYYAHICSFCSRHLGLAMLHTAKVCQYKMMKDIVAAENQQTVSKSNEKDEDDDEFIIQMKNDETID
jgi:hypothetical protein